MHTTDKQNSRPRTQVHRIAESIVDSRVVITRSVADMENAEESESEFAMMHTALKPTLTRTISKMTDPVVTSPWSEDSTGLKVLFLSSDTGGGHRASAESLGNRFQRLFPGAEYFLLDIMTDHAPAPYNDLKSWYKHLSAHPNQWNFVYKISNTKAYNKIQDVHLKLVSERAVRERILQIAPDVVVSVHPLMNAVPVLSCQKISSRTNRHIPIFTVVTDLGSAHSSWFDKGVEKMYVASDQIRMLAKDRKNVPDEKLVRTGLPIRHDFAVQADFLEDRFSAVGKDYMRSTKEKLNLDTSLKTILIMGGGEGCGALSSIVNALYVEFYVKGIDAQIMVVCGRNEALQQELRDRDWSAVLTEHEARQLVANDILYSCEGMSVPLSGCGTLAMVGCIEGGTVGNHIRKILSNSSLSMLPLRGSSSTNLFARSETPPTSPLPIADTLDSALSAEELAAKIDTALSEHQQHQQDDYSYPASDSSTQADEAAFDSKFIPGRVSVIGLGFVNNMAEYMVASDVLVTKAGPGTIAEAASLSLPVMLTSFLPGQEEGNVDFVVEGNFGSYVSDKDPPRIAEEVATWLLDEHKLETLSKAAKQNGAPHAAAQIVQDIGESTLRWKVHNQELAAADTAAGIKRDNAPSPEPILKPLPIESDSGDSFHDCTE